MNKYSIGIVLSALALLSTACKQQKNSEKLVINEVLVDNEANFQDDYGVHSAWIEVFNQSYANANLAGCLLKVSTQPGDTATYFIPKGDVLTNISPRQHALFWADGNPRRGTFHTNFVLSKTGANWIGLCDSGGRLIDQVTVPAGTLQADQSYARVDDGSPQWEVKDGSVERYVTPSTNNKTIESNPKVEKFTIHDPIGIGMTILAMAVVFVGLILLYICFRYVGRLSVRLRKRAEEKAAQAKAATTAAAAAPGEIPGEVAAAIAMALHEAQGAGHDMEEAVITIARRDGSPWSAKAHTLRQDPRK